MQLNILKKNSLEQLEAGINDNIEKYVSDVPWIDQYFADKSMAYYYRSFYYLIHPHQSHRSDLGYLSAICEPYMHKNLYGLDKPKDEDQKQAWDSICLSRHHI